MDGTKRDFGTEELDGHRLDPAELIERKTPTHLYFIDEAKLCIQSDSERRMFYLKEWFVENGGEEPDEADLRLKKADILSEMLFSALPPECIDVH